MPDEDNTFSGSLVLDLRNWWRHVHTPISVELESRRSSQGGGGGSVRSMHPPPRFSLSYPFNHAYNFRNTGFFSKFHIPLFYGSRKERLQKRFMGVKNDSV